MNQNPSTHAPMHRRTALITGASAGIGAAFADVFAAEGYDLVLAARRLDRLESVAARVRQQHGVRVEVIASDLSVGGAGARLCDEIAARGIVIDALVNNAGYGVPGDYLRRSWDEHAAFLNVMLVGVAELTRRLLPGMVERRFGRVINVASLAGLVPAPAGHTLYAATKAFLIKFSEALAHEVADRGVRVTALCPGFTYSEFHDVTGTRATVSRLPKFMWLDAPTVARLGYDATERGEVIAVTGRVNRTIALLARLLPYRLVSSLNGRSSRAYRVRD
jgi:short-subunit dehydrogenase